MINVEKKLADGTLLFGWEADPPLTPVAPSDAYYLTEKKIFSEEECEEWGDYLLEQEPILLDKLRHSSGNGYTGLPDTSITSRYGQFNFLKSDFHLVPKLKTEIFNSIKTIIPLFDKTNWQETLYGNSWFNVLRQGEGMEMHMHGYHKYTFYGFHLTINATETFTSYHHPIKFLEDAFHVPNKIGYLTLFPSFIPHSVSRNRYETPRISIAGDVFPSTWLVEDSNNEIQRIDHLMEIGTYNNDNELQETK